LEWSFHSRTPRRRLLVFALLAGQFALLWQPPSYHAPPLDSAARFGALHRALERCAQGAHAVALDFPLLAAEPFVHTMALSDLRLAGASQPLARDATSALLNRLASRDRPMALALGERFPALTSAVESHYEGCARLRAPSLPPAGYRPGWRGADGERYQVVYRARDREPR
jgi:hypothetical protein